MRAAAVLHILAARIGAENPNQFAAYFDSKVDMLTQLSGKWRLGFSGKKPLSAQQRALLARLDADVDGLHDRGPAELWRAMWGQSDELQSVLSDELRKWRTLDMVLAEFEGEILLAECEHAPLALTYLAKAIALYRLHRQVEAIAPVGLDGEGIRRCLRLCLENAGIQQELSLLGVKQAIDTELTNWIVSLPGMEVAWASAEARWDAISPRLHWVD